jgi:hypothetical protein|tara:strand:- start:241 stop:486 length:246 start_codon:yes stop_codon:yes gene_type:complete
MEFDVKIWKVTFKVIVRSLDILVCCPRTGGTLWALRPEKNCVTGRIELVTGFQFAKPEILHFEEDIKKKCLTLYKKNLKKE